MFLCLGLVTKGVINVQRERGPLSTCACNPGSRQDKQSLIKVGPNEPGIDVLCLGSEQEGQLELVLSRREE